MSMIDRLIKMDDALQANPESRYIVMSRSGEKKIATGEQLLDMATKGNIASVSYGRGNLTGQIAKQLCTDKNGFTNGNFNEVGGY